MQTRFRRGVNILGHSFCKNNGLIPIYSLHAFLGTRTAGTMSFAFFLKGNGDKSVISQISVV